MMKSTWSIPAIAVVIQTRNIHPYQVATDLIPQRMSLKIQILN